LPTKLYKDYFEKEERYRNCSHSQLRDDVTLNPELAWCDNCDHIIHKKTLLDWKEHYENRVMKKFVIFFAMILLIAFSLKWFYAN